MLPTKPSETVQVSTVKFTRGRVRYCILGETPLICNRMSQKAKQELFMPKGRKTAAEKASSLKHDPLKEFRDSPYTLREDDAPTFIGIIATSFKKAIMGAALDQPGAKKAQIGRLVYVNDSIIPIFGVPEVMCAVTRSADIARTPDVRTRAILPRWACIVDVTYSVPILREPDITNLLSTAGQTQGIGDWRIEKGSGNYGQFVVTDEDDPAFLDIVAHGGRAEQIAAMENPASYDSETDELLSWFDVESKRRGFKVA